MIEARCLAAPLPTVHQIFDGRVGIVGMAHHVHDLHSWLADHDGSLLKRPKL